MPHRKENWPHRRGAPGTQAHQTHTVLYHRYRPDFLWQFCKISCHKNLQSHHQVAIGGCEDRRDNTVPRPIPVRLAPIRVPLVYGALSPRELWPRDGLSTTSSRRKLVAIKTCFHIFFLILSQIGFSCLTNHTSRPMASGAIGTRAGRIGY